jgi:hypothetical protein
MSDIQRLRVTHTVAILEVPMDTYVFIATKLRDAGYDHAFDANSGYGAYPAIDMGGIALVPTPTEAKPEEFVVNTTGQSLAFLMLRALNTLEPVHQPAWANPLTDFISPDDVVLITVTRAAKG